MSILNKITSNIFLFTLFEFILLILLFLTLYVWKPTLEPIKRIFIQHDIDVSNVNVNIYDRNPLIRAVIMFSCIFLMSSFIFFETVAYPYPGRSTINSLSFILK